MNPGLFRSGAVLAGGTRLGSVRGGCAGLPDCSSLRRWRFSDDRKISRSTIIWKLGSQLPSTQASAIMQQSR